MADTDITVTAYTLIPTTYDQASGTSVVTIKLGINHKGLKYLKRVEVSEPMAHGFAVDEVMRHLHEEVFYPASSIEPVKYPSLMPKNPPVMDPPAEVHSMVVSNEKGFDPFEQSTGSPHEQTA